MQASAPCRYSSEMPGTIFASADIDRAAPPDLDLSIGLFDQQMQGLVIHERQIDAFFGGALSPAGATYSNP